MILILVTSMVFTSEKKAEAVVPILPILYYLVGGLVADKAVEMGVGFATKEIAKSKTESIAKDIVLKYEKELTQFPPTKKGAAKALWKYGGKILAEIVSALAGLAATTLLNGKEEDEDLTPSANFGGSYPVYVDYTNFSNTSDFATLSFYKNNFNFSTNVTYNSSIKTYVTWLNVIYGGCTTSIPTTGSAFPLHSQPPYAGKDVRINVYMYDSSDVPKIRATVGYLDAGKWEEDRSAIAYPFFANGGYPHVNVFSNDFGCASSLQSFKDTKQIYIANYVNNTVNNNYITHNDVTINKNITYNQFYLKDVPSSDLDKVDWSKVFPNQNFEKEYDLDLSAFPRLKQLFDDLEVDAPIDFDLSDWTNTQNNLNFVQYPSVGTGGLTKDQIDAISVSVNVDVTLPPDKDGDGGDVDELDGSLLAYVRNAYKYATEVIETAVDGLKSLAYGATGLTTLYKTFFGWLPKEIQVLMASGLGIMIGLRIFRK